MTGSDHVGGDLIPMLVDKGEAHVYDFTENRVPEETSATTTIGRTSEHSTPTTPPIWT